MASSVPLTPDVLAAFGLEPESPGRAMTGGHINDTYDVQTSLGRFVLQRINHQVFPSPENIMENVIAVTDYLRGRLAVQGGDPNRGTLAVRRTIDGKGFYLSPEGNYWRCTSFISGASSHEVATGPKMLREAGRAFGNFQRMLADFPADTLHEIIPKFHDTPDRFRQLREAVLANRAGRVEEVMDELAFAAERRDSCGLLMVLLAEGGLPLRVTHNDTKMSNVLMDDATGEAVCVIDLDTVMPGLTAFDFGDSIRAGASTAAEDEADLSLVHFDLEAFTAYAQGFLSAAGSALSSEELRTLPDGAILMTYEVGIRFLTDYLNGDVYFRTAYPTHNLVRCRNQFKLVAEMEERRKEMEEIVFRTARG